MERYFVTIAGVAFKSLFAAAVHHKSGPKLVKVLEKTIKALSNEFSVPNETERFPYTSCIALELEHRILLQRPSHFESAADLGARRK